MGGGKRLAVAALLVLGAACAPGPTQPDTLLRVLMTDDWVTPPFLDAVRSFERDRPRVRVVIEKGPINLIPDGVRAGIASGAPPDLVQGHAFSAAAQGLAQPLDDLWAGRLDPRDFLPGALEDVTWAGRRYGVPLDTNALVLLYNAAHFRAAGLAEPGPTTTFAELEAMAAALTAADGSRRGFVVPNSTWWTYGWIRANGGDTVDLPDGGPPRLTLDSPATVGAVSFLAGLIRKGYAFGPRAADSHTGDAVALFGSGAASMYASGSWDLTALRKVVPGADFRAAPLPRGEGIGSAMGGSSMWVPATARHRELAFELMVDLISDASALRLAREEGRLPVRTRLLGDPSFVDRDQRVFLDQLPTAHPPRLGAFDRPSEEFAAALESVYRPDGPDPALALAEAQRRAVADRGP